MAMPIKETPILKGEDARRFLNDINDIKKESKEEVEKARQAFQNFESIATFRV